MILKTHYLNLLKESSIMKKVGIFDTAIGTSNNGDEIIYQSSIKGLKSILDNSFSLRLGTHIANYDKKQMKKDNFKINYFTNDCDLKFVMGTSIVLEKLSGIHRQWMLFDYNKKLYKDVILVGVGKNILYDSIDSSTAKIYKSILNNQYKHSVRDEFTKKVLEDIGIDSIVTGCPTLWEFDKDKCELIPKSKSDACIISLSGQKKYHNIEADQQLINIVNNNYSKVYVWIQTLADEPYFDSFENISNIEKIYSLSKYEDILNKGNVDYVGTRLHGGIFAMQHNVRTIIIAIDQRAIGMYESNNIPILKREEINNLHFLINSSFKTDIKIDNNKISSFINQFL